MRRIGLVLALLIGALFVCGRVGAATLDARDLGSGSAGTDVFLAWASGSFAAFTAIPVSSTSFPGLAQLESSSSDTSGAHVVTANDTRLLTADGATIVNNGSGTISTNPAPVNAKQSSICATTTTLPSNTYSNGSSGVGATLTATAMGVLTVDGHSVTIGDRVLVKNESAGANNGIYTCTVAGTSLVAYVLTRSTDNNTSGDFVGAYVLIEAGTANAGTGWIVTNTTAPDVGTDSIGWAAFGGGGSGTVTSIALTMPSEFSVSGSPVTSAGTFTVTKANETANYIYAGPSSGSAAAPTFRALAASDIPSLSYVTGFSSGNLSPLFTTSVASSTTTPSQTFSLSNAAGYSWFGNASGSSGAPSYNTSAIPAAIFPALTGDTTNTAGSLATTTGKVQGIPYQSGSPPIGDVYVSTSVSGVTTMVPTNPATIGAATYTATNTSWAPGQSLTVTHSSDAGPGYLRVPSLIAEQSAQVPTLLMHFDGTNGSTTMTDSTGNFSPSAVGTAALGTTKFQYGTASLSCTANTAYVNIPYSTLLEPGSGNFTIDCWIYPTSITIGSASDRVVLFDHVNSGVTNGYSFYLAGATGDLVFVAYNASGTAFMDLVGTEPSTNVWTHIGVERSGNNWYLLEAGKVASDDLSISTAIGTQTADADIQHAVSVGSSELNLTGYQDEVRYVQGTALFTIAGTTPNFTYTIPSFPGSANPYIGPVTIGQQNIDPGQVYCNWGDVNGNNTSTETTFFNATTETLDATAIVTIP